MPSSLKLLLSGSLLILFGVGLWIGGAFRDRLHAPAAVTPPTPTPSQTTSDISALIAAEKRGQQLQRRIDTLELALHAADGTQPPEPEPVAPATTAPEPFPEGLADQYTAVGFEQVVRDLVKECGLEVDLAEVDCSEFPCVAWVRSKDLSLERASPTACEGWKRAFGDGATVTYHLTGTPFGGRTERFHVWVATPPSQDRDANQRLINRGQSRMNARWEAMHAGSAP